MARPEPARATRAAGSRWPTAVRRSRFISRTIAAWSWCDPTYYGKGTPQAVADSDFRRRFTETAVALHAELYVMGQARERQDVVAPEIAQDPAAPMFLISTQTEQQISSG